MSAVRDITGDPHYPTVVRMTFDTAPPVRELANLREDAPGPTPVRVCSVQQMRAFAKHVAVSSDGSHHGLVADPGLGKSTRFPLMLADISKSVVLVVEYCTSLADCIAEGLVRVQEQEGVCTKIPVVHYIKNNKAGLDLSSLTGPYVVVIAAKTLVARVALGRKFPDSIVLHDESHYCDYGTFVWRAISSQLTWVKRRVSMSATLTPTIMSDKSSIDGVKHCRSDVAINIPPVKAWCFDVEPSTDVRPWMLDRLRGRNTLVLSDDPVGNKSYARVLEKHGFSTHVLNTGDDLYNVREARLNTYKQLSDVVVFASSAYRNGFNFGVEVVIDCGSVREQFIDGDRVLERFRLVNQTEVLQGAARVGRSKDGIAYRPTGEFPSTVPLLSLGEVWHAAALLVLTAFRPTGLLVDLVAETAGWDAKSALAIVASTLHDIVRSTNATEGDRTDRNEQGELEAKLAQASIGSNGSGKQNSRLSDLLAEASDLSLENRHVDDAFPANHPGVRYDAPTSYYAQSAPYWVGEVDSQRMLRMLLREEGRHDVMMLTDAELQWFVGQLTTAWNAAADVVVESGILLSMTKRAVEDVYLMPDVVQRVRVTQQETALQVRSMEATMRLMRDLYARRPFAVRARFVEDEVTDLQSSRKTLSAVAEAVRPAMSRVSLSHRVPVEKLLTSSDRNGPVPYTWYNNKPAQRRVTRFDARTIGTSSDASGSNRS